MNDVRRVADLLPLLESVDFHIGAWAGGDLRPDGTITMPYFEYSAEARELIAGLPVTAGFDWPTWMKTPRAQQLVADHNLIADATVDDLVRLTTAIVRSDRFTEGSIAGAFESGLLLAVVRRAAALASEY